MLLDFCKPMCYIECMVATKSAKIFSIFQWKNFDYPEKPLKYKHIRRISD